MPPPQPRSPPRVTSGRPLNHDAVLTLVGLLHPKGYARRGAIIGPSTPTYRDDDALDVVLLMPAVEQWRNLSWRIEALATTAAALAPDGIVFAVAPRRRHRRSMRTALANNGLRIVEQVAVLPSRSEPRHLVPLGAASVGHALLQIPRGGALAAKVGRVAAETGVLGRLLPAVGYLAQRPGSIPRLNWLGGRDSASRGAWLVRGNWRGHAGATVVLALEPSSSQVSLVAKVGNPDDAAREAQALRTVAAGAAFNGMRTATWLRSLRLREKVAIIEEGIEGQPGAVWLARRPGRLNEFLAMLVRWLEQWAMASREDAVIEVSEFHAAVLKPAQRLTSMLADPDSYLDWLAGLGNRVVGTRLARIAAHNDLTMWNVLVAPSGRIGVLDWAESQARTIPLGDVAYAVVDAVASVERYRSRPDAFAACFSPDARRPQGVGWLRQVAAKLDLSGDAQALCFHACWLRHAVNELEQEQGRAGPFIAIVRQLAAQRAMVAGDVAP